MRDRGDANLRDRGFRRSYERHEQREVTLPPGDGNTSPQLRLARRMQQHYEQTKKHRSHPVVRGRDP